MLLSCLLLAAMDSDKWFVVFAGLLTAFQWWKEQQAKQRAEEARLREEQAQKDRALVAAKVDEVKKDLKVNTATTQEIYKQGNGAKTVMLATIATQAQRLAELTDKPEDIAVAKVTAQQLAAHEESQK